MTYEEYKTEFERALDAHNKVAKEHFNLSEADLSPFVLGESNGKHKDEYAVQHTREMVESVDPERIRLEITAILSSDIKFLKRDMESGNIILDNKGLHLIENENGVEKVVRYTQRV